MRKLSELKRDWLRHEIAELAAKGVTKANIARELEVKPQYLNTLLNSDRGITDQFLDKFIEKYNINQFDLIKDEGEILTSTPSSDNTLLLTLIKQKDERIEELSKKVGRLERELEERASGCFDGRDADTAACADAG